MRSIALPFQNNLERFILEYYVIYDLKDNVVAYCDDIVELINFTKLRLKDIHYKFRKNSFDDTFNYYVFIIINKKKYKIYKFFDEKVERPFFVCYNFF